MAVGDFHENGKLEKMGKWARIYQRFCKTSNEVAKREILTNGDYKKMANFGRKREISAKNGEYAKKSLAKYSHKMTKKGIWTNGDLFGKNL